MSIGMVSAARHGERRLTTTWAPGEADRRRRAGVLHLAQVVHPRAGGVEHQAGVHAELAAVQAVAQLGAGDPAAGEAQAGDLGVVEHHGAGVDGGAHGHHRDARVVHLVVAVDGHRAQALGTQCGHLLGGVGGGGNPAHAVAEGGQRRVQEHAGAELGRAVRAALVDRHEEGQRVDQVRGHVGGERAALLVVLRDKLDRAGLQVAQTAVDELGGSAGGGTGEVAGVDHGDLQAGLGRGPGDGRAEDAAPDHQQVVGGLAEQLAGLGAGGGAAGGALGAQGRDGCHGGCVRRAGRAAPLLLSCAVRPLREGPVGPVRRAG